MIAIKAQELSKRYRIATGQGRNDTLRDLVSSGLRALVRRNERQPNGKEEIWALKNVSFEVQEGETLGIIGGNGAGKSTLLKVLSRITEPTAGSIRVNGRIASLLEVGTGFHPELTGRENIFLNGAILGMRRHEIRRKFDEIVSFAETGRFLDTPVKRYSSGMYVRLAFAVAAHLEPDILVVDEVLAVGDAAFQRKCLGKMGTVAKEGRTVLFVSHNMVAVNTLCSRAIWLKSGQIVKDGPSKQVVMSYLDESELSPHSAEEVWSETEKAPGNDTVRLHSIRVRPQNGRLSGPLTMQTPFAVEVEFWNLEPDARLDVSLVLFTDEGVPAFSTDSFNTMWSDRPMPPSLFRSRCYIPGNLMNSGRYRAAVLIVKDRSVVIYRYEKGVSIEIHDMEERKGAWHGKHLGVVQPVLKWTTECLSKDSGIFIESQRWSKGIGS